MNQINGNTVIEYGAIAPVLTALLLAQSVAAHRRYVQAQAHRLNSPTVDRWVDLHRCPLSVTDEDLHMASQMREYYRNKLIVKALAAQTHKSSSFATDLYTLLNSEYQTTSANFGMIALLPYQYVEDLRHDAIETRYPCMLDSYVVDNNPSSKHMHMQQRALQVSMSSNDTDSLALRYFNVRCIEVINRVRAKAEGFEFWFDIGCEFPAKMVLPTKDPMLEVAFDMFEKGSVRTIGFVPAIGLKIGRRAKYILIARFYLPKAAA